MPTGLENELLNDSTVGSSEDRVYSGVYHMNEWSGLETGGLYSQHSREYVNDVTQAELEDYFSRSRELNDTFGDFDTYLAYMDERQDLIDSGFDANWINAPQATGEMTKENADMFFGLSTMLAQGIPLNAEQQATYDDLKSQGYQADGGFLGTGSAGGIDTAADYQGSFDAVMGSDEMTALNDKYGISNESFQNDSGSMMQWTGSGYIQTDEAEGIDLAFMAMMAAATFFTAGAGGAIAGALAPGLSGVAGGALQGAISGTLSGAIQGDIDPKSILQSAVLGAIGGLGDGLVNGTIQTTGDVDKAIWDLSAALNMSPEEIIRMAEGMATGAIAGGELTDIIGGAIQGWGTIQIQDAVKTIYGDEVNVDDWFKDGESTIPVEAFNPIIKGTLEAAFNGGASTEDILKMALGYFQEGGDIDFMLPELKDWLGELDMDIPGLDFEKSDEWDLVVDPETGDVTVNWTMPDLGDGLDVDIECPEGWVSENGHCIEINIPDIQCPEGWVSENGHCVEINIPDIQCPEGWENVDGECLQIDIQCPEGWVSENGHCVEINVPDIQCPEGWVSENGHCVEVSVLECMEGWEWSDLYGKCVEKIEVPDVLECMEGFEWDGQQCVEIPDVLECMEGWEWSDLYGKCVEKIPDDVDVLECMEGWEWSDLYGKCVEKIPDDVDILECMEGWEWSDLYGKCVEKIEVPDAIECMEGWEWSDLYGECIEKINDDTKCPEGFVSEAGHCVEIKVPDIEVPDIPEPPPAPEAQQGDFTPTWTGLFQAGTVDVYKAPPLRSLFKDYL